jgi:hypothetical protein
LRNSLKDVLLIADNLIDVSDSDGWRINPIDRSAGGDCNLFRISAAGIPGGMLIWQANEMGRLQAAACSHGGAAIDISYYDC